MSQTTQKLTAPGTSSQLWSVTPPCVLSISSQLCLLLSSLAACTLESHFPRHSEKPGSPSIVFSLPFKAQSTSQGNNFSHPSCQKSLIKTQVKVTCWHHVLLWESPLSPLLFLPLQKNLGNWFNSTTTLQRNQLHDTLKCKQRALVFTE